MGVERGSAGGFQFVGFKQLLQPLALFLPLVIIGIKDLGQSTPADVTHQYALLLVRCRPSFGFQALEQLNGGEVLAALLFQRATSQAVSGRNSVVGVVADRLGVKDRCFLARKSRITLLVVICGLGNRQRVAGFVAVG